MKYLFLVKQLFYVNNIVNTSEKNYTLVAINQEDLIYHLEKIYHLETCHAVGREFDSGRTNNQGVKVTE